MQEDISTSIIRDQSKIITKLHQLIKSNNPITTHVRAYNLSFVTKLLDVNKKDKRLIFDGCPDNLKALFYNASFILFETVRLGAKVVFDTGFAKNTEYEGKDAFTVPLPELLIWFDQREFYRVKTPTSSKIYCQLNVEEHEPINLKIHDICISGFSLIIESTEVFDLFQPETIFEGCKLIIGDSKIETVSFEIKYKILISPRVITKRERVGCKFTEIRPDFQNYIHNYMMEVEREILRGKEVCK